MKNVKPDLSDSEIDVIEGCLRAVAYGPFFDEWEFNTLFGMERRDIENILLNWPEIVWQNEANLDAIIGSMNQLTGYPHGMESELKRFTGVEAHQIRTLLEDKVVPFSARELS